MAQRTKKWQQELAAALRKRGRTNITAQDIAFLQLPNPRIRSQPRSVLLQRLTLRDGLKCQGCDTKVPDAGFLEIDHRKPKSKGGSDHINNLQLLCGPCNRLKSDRLTTKEATRAFRREHSIDGGV